MKSEYLKLLVDFRLSKKIDHSLHSVAPEAFAALVDEGLIESNGTFTDLGRVRSKKVADLSATLLGGVDISKRPVEALDIKDQVWKTGSYDKNSYVTDGATLIVANMAKDVSVERGTPTERTRAGVIFKRAAGLKAMKPLIPFLWQRWLFERHDVVWLKSADDKIFIPIKGLYYDLMLEKFANPTFHGKLIKGVPSIVQVRIEKGSMKYNRVHGLITPLVITDPIPTVCRG